MKIILLKTILLIILLYTNLISQTITSTNYETFPLNLSIKTDTVISYAMRNSIFGELGGNGVLITLNYEYLILKNIGIRVGYGGMYGVGSSMPMMINYYIGKEKKLELGVGLVYLPVWKSNINLGEEKTGLLAFTIGHKYQKETGGLVLRISLTPFYSFQQNRFLFFGGVSAGIAF
jgi:hypothetical protein